ncbi:cell wall-binding repeat-containing protein [Herbiconiux sp.]|uniref:cell wall-binding repeat-containing protein n=1 Tax=Herbiconiux sp. TaxID=1871186 RepID=UPI0025B7D9E7|nr:cell wall-binding repeat-containing protein [Herbiconiux sp.]
MSHRPILSRLTVATLALTTLAAGGVVSAAHADALIAPAITCPSTVAAVGFPVDFGELAKGATALSVKSGTLPAGVSVSSEGGFHLAGDPTTVQASTFTLTATFPSAPPAEVEKECAITVKPAPTVTRIAGSDRYQQALKVSAQFATAITVFVASGEKYPDALSATAVAAANKAPLLLTPSGSLPTGLLAEITRLGATKVVVVGGENTISATTFTQLKAAGRTVTRISGADRYEVSRNLISDPTVGIATAENVFVATGANFPDALTASPAAIAARGPVLLVNGSEAAPTALESALLTKLGAKKVFIAGGTNSVSAALETSLSAGFTVTRFAGADRYAVGVNLNRAAFTAPGSFVLASGSAFADALSGGVPAGLAKAPVYVTPATCLDNQVYLEIGRLAPEKIVVLGGTNTLSADVEALKPCGLD